MLETIGDLASETAWRPVQLRCPVGLLVGVRCLGEPPQPVVARLREKELKHAASLSPTRQREWIAGRLCLRTGLELCSADGDLLHLPSGAPLTPGGFAGSISHKQSLAIALVVPNQASCGADIETIEERDEALVRRIMTPEERRRSTSATAATLHFSAKEAIYKLLPTEIQLDIDFEDIQLAHVAEKDGWATYATRIAGAGDVLVHACTTDGWVLALATQLQNGGFEQP